MITYRFTVKDESGIAEKAELDALADFIIDEFRKFVPDGTHYIIEYIPPEDVKNNLAVTWDTEEERRIILEWSVHLTKKFAKPVELLDKYYLLGW